MAKADYDYEILSEVEQLELIANVHKFRLLVGQIQVIKCKSQDDFSETVDQLFDNIFRNPLLKKELH
tara:strand:- start:8069 stop:8269 length:201 start_codon:yes stop_codon:yes gene_type:complete